MISARGARYDNPDGIVDFGNAENFLMHNLMTEYINHRRPFQWKLCTYNEGATGSTRLCSAMAGLVNDYFAPLTPISADHITFTAGVTALNEMITQVLCNEGDTIMLGRPSYGSFNKDLVLRTDVQLEYVGFNGADQFAPEVVDVYADALKQARERGSKVRALLVCNPHNPLGRCYPQATLERLVDFCVSEDLHLISDEIYALSIFNPTAQFTSVLGCGKDTPEYHNRVHVLYGMSKDFAGAGLRLGCLISRSKVVNDAIRPICRFASPSEISGFLAAELLDEKDLVKSFIEQSRKALFQSHRFAAGLLHEAGIKYYWPVDAGFFILMDLSSFLPLLETNGDAWAAERLLSKCFMDQKVDMSRGEVYHDERPGQFRLIHSFDQNMIIEGVRRIRKVLGI
ncbi:PLP-dependent transferase [Rhizodiscina lignyota]|uniref:PLP-dependent transferase n=1 Tax=Rhizodiscina lignyota TaxID=1504668 RepID=A0A9P4IHI8_9PEZI|nr:PLP-dependent transferase [Rhizodiscina lignyota]